MKKQNLLFHPVSKIVRVLTMLVLLTTRMYSQTISTVAGNGVAGYSGDGGPATAAELDYPLFVIQNNVCGTCPNPVFITEGTGNRIRMISTTRIITTVAGNGVTGFSGDGGQATAAELDEAYGLYLNYNGNFLYIADALNYRVRQVNLATGIINTVAGNGVFGYSGDGGQATAAEIGDVTSITQNQTTGDYYITDNSTSYIRMINTSHIISTIAGNGVAGYSGDGGQATAAEINNPWTISIDQSNGNLYFTDYGNWRVREINTSGIISTIAGNGTHGCSGDGGPATAAELYYPYALSVEADHDVYIVDLGCNTVRIVNTSGNISTFAGNGYGSPTSGGYSGDGGAATAAELWYPQGVFANGLGGCLIADRDNSRIRYVNMAPSALTGANDLNNEQEEISVFPNPTKGEFELSGLKEGYSIELYNYTGQRINVYRVSASDRVDLNISDHPSGIYYLRILSKDGSFVANKKVVKTK